MGKGALDGTGVSRVVPTVKQGHAPAAVALIAGGCFPETWEGPGSSDLNVPTVGRVERRPGDRQSLE